MKIIQKGILPEVRPRRGKCVFCGCVIEFLPNEDGVIYNKQTESFLIKCPTVGCSFDINVSSIPPNDLIGKSAGLIMF